MNVRPLYDRVLVKRNDEPTRTQSGLFLPDNAKEKPVEGTVVAVGGGKVKIDAFDCAVFDGQYVTGDVNEQYLDRIEQARNDAAKSTVERVSAIIDLHNN